MHKRIILHIIPTETMKIACASILLAAISGAQAFAPSPLGRSTASSSLSVTKAELSGAESMIDSILREKNCGPVFVRLAEPVKESYPGVSYADIFQMASVLAIALAGGPIVDMKYGRFDATGPEECSPEGNLPDAEAGPGGKFGGPGGTAPTEDSAVEWHLRKVFYRMGLGDEEIVALSGAHTFDI